MNIPAFFIVGTPKAGTSSLYDYLCDHSEIVMSNPKEPHYFCQDFSEKLRVGNSVTDYLTKCFGGSEYDGKLRGEATSTYLYSDEAVPNILALNAAAKFIVMLRNPYDMALALHSQCVRDGDENVRSFDEAWQLQELRAMGLKVPPKCREKKFLQYASFCKTGTQVERLLQLAPLGNIHFVFFEDFCHSTEKEFSSILEFLGVKHRALRSFPIRNTRKDMRSFAVGEALNRLPNWLISIVSVTKRLLGIRSLGFMRRVRSFNEKPSQRNEPDYVTIRAMEDVFEKEINKLSQLTGRDLSIWSKGSRPAERSKYV